MGVEIRTLRLLLDMIIFLAILGLHISFVVGHGAVVYPPPRNRVDYSLPPWSSGVPNPIPAVSNPDEGYWCPVPDGPSTLSGSNGQACFWFSNGCSIGCPNCDGTTRGPSIHTGKTDICGLKFNATICDPNLRTVNTGAKCGSDADSYYYSPWRAPGSSPVFDACGMAGGTRTWGHHGAQYRTTPHAKQGDYGSQSLQESTEQPQWKAGGTVNVSWSITANHGGGYQYRLCPKGENLTEACFQKNPLNFVGLQSFVWGDGTQIFFQGTYVSVGTTPKGSTWAMNPVPRNDTANTGESSKPRCKEIPNCGSTDVNSKCLCSGMWGPYDLLIVDTLKIPDNIPLGDYVLGWRWDCEESTQIWASCSDVTIEA